MDRLYYLAAVLIVVVPLMKGAGKLLTYYEGIYGATTTLLGLGSFLIAATIVFGLAFKRFELRE